MPLGGLNGHPFRRAPVRPEEPSSTLVLQRIEVALDMMMKALVLSGFSEYEAGEVNLSTRAAITTKVKGRR